MKFYLLGMIISVFLCACGHQGNSINVPTSEFVGTWLSQSTESLLYNKKIALGQPPGAHLHFGQKFCAGAGAKGLDTNHFVIAANGEITSPKMLQNTVQYVAMGRVNTAGVFHAYPAIEDYFSESQQSLDLPKGDVRPFTYFIYSEEITGPMLEVETEIHVISELGPLIVPQRQPHRFTKVESAQQPLLFAQTVDCLRE